MDSGLRDKECVCVFWRGEGGEGWRKTSRGRGGREEGGGETFKQGDWLLSAGTREMSYDEASR